MTDGPSCWRYRHFDQTMKTLITARLSSTEGERVTSLIKTQVAIGMHCIMERSAITSYERRGVTKTTTMLKAAKNWSDPKGLVT